MDITLCGLLGLFLRIFTTFAKMKPQPNAQTNRTPIAIKALVVTERPPPLVITSLFTLSSVLGLRASELVLDL
jgi:hypothetical protein